MKSKTELLLFLTPEIVRDIETLEAIGDQMHEDAEIVDDAVEPGTLKRHLDQMKTRHDELDAPTP